jgi:hypothetical protein
MKLSQMREAYILACERQNLEAMLFDIEAVLAGEMDEDDGDTAVGIQVNGWNVDVPAERVGDLIELARAAAEKKIAEIESNLAALGVEIDDAADAEQLEDA